MVSAPGHVVTITFITWLISAITVSQQNLRLRIALLRLQWPNESITLNGPAIRMAVNNIGAVGPVKEMASRHSGNSPSTTARAELIGICCKLWWVQDLFITNLENNDDYDDIIIIISTTVMIIIIIIIMIIITIMIIIIIMMMIIIMMIKMIMIMKLIISNNDNDNNDKMSTLTILHVLQITIIMMMISSSSPP